MGLSAALLVLAAVGARGDALRGDGDFEFYLDIASLPAGGNGVIQLLQIAIPTKELKYVEKDGTYVADVRFTLNLRSEEQTVYKKTFQMRDSREAAPTVKDLSSFLYAVDSCVVDPGLYRLTVKVEDLQRRKKSLLGLLHRTYLASQVKDAVLEIPAYAADRIELGDPILVWSYDAKKRFIPNPMQVYGLRKDTLTVLVNALLPPSSSADSLTVHLSLNKERGEVMADEVFAVPVLADRSSFARSFDLATYPAGDYSVAVEVQAEGGQYASASKEFNVAWELLNWQKPMRDILVEARILLRDKEYETFEQMTLGEQESFMKGFWKKVDPTPQTAVNETYEKFVSRVRYADAHFGLFERGALSDRGYIFIRLGQPDEVIRKPVPKDRGDLYEGIEKIEDEYKIFVDGSSSRPGVLSTLRPPIYSPEKKRALRGLVGGDAGSFEIWTYNIKGDPLLAEDKGMTVRQGMRFLFVDKDGFGDYRLLGTSEEITQ
jgi:GWxTD domain-containing protein